MRAFLSGLQWPTIFAIAVFIWMWLSLGAWYSAEERESRGQQSILIGFTKALLERKSIQRLGIVILLVIALALIQQRRAIPDAWGAALLGALAGIIPSAYVSMGGASPATRRRVFQGSFLFSGCVLASILLFAVRG